MENFLESVVKRHEQGKKLSEGDIDFLIGVANSSVKLQEENARLREALEKILDEEETNLEGYKTTVYEIAEKALGVSE